MEVALPDEKPVKTARMRTKMRKTATRVRVKERSPVPVAPQPQETEYSDEQFYADLRKASKRLDEMEREALEEHARGETLKFPL